MSSSRRPWYPWYPKDFVVDEKVQSLSDDAELVYRRALDVLWQANDLQLPSNCLKLANALARGWSSERFENAWNEIQHPGFELLKVSEDGNWVYSSRLKKEAQKIENICKKRSEAGKKGGVSKSQANAEQTLSHTDPDIKYKIKGETEVSPNGSCPYQKIVGLYHSILPELSSVRILNDKRKAQLRARWSQGIALKDGTKSDTLEFWEKYFNFVRESNFLMGLVDPQPGRQRFSADLEWLTNISNLTKVFEGKYHK